MKTLNREYVEDVIQKVQSTRQYNSEIMIIHELVEEVKEIIKYNSRIELNEFVDEKKMKRLKEILSHLELLI